MPRKASYGWFAKSFAIASSLEPDDRITRLFGVVSMVEKEKKTPPAEAKATPAEAKETPAEAKAVPAEVKDAPVEAKAESEAAAPAATSNVVAEEPSVALQTKNVDDIDLEDDSAIAAKKPSVKGDINKGTMSLVDIECDEATLSDILRQFRKTTNANIISDDSTNLQKRVSVSLKHVPWLQGLMAILGREYVTGAKLEPGDRPGNETMKLDMSPVDKRHKPTGEVKITPVTE